MKTKVLPALLIAGAFAVAGCGESSDRAASRPDSTAEAAGNPIDRAFAAEMIPHHESAVQMGEIAQQRGQSKFVKQLAADILRTQKAEISTLRREDAELADAGVKTGSLGVPEHMMGMSEDTEQLETVTPFDDPFIKMMVPHHKGAIEMAKVELAKGSDPELKTLAQKIIDAQQREIEAMTEHLAGAAGDEEHHGAATPDAKPVTPGPPDADQPAVPLRRPPRPVAARATSLPRPASKERVMSHHRPNTASTPAGAG